MMSLQYHFYDDDKNVLEQFWRKLSLFYLEKLQFVPRSVMK